MYIETEALVGRDADIRQHHTLKHSEAIFLSLFNYSST